MKSVRILNRIVTMTKEGIEYESDQRHAEIIVKQMGLQPGSRAVATPSVSVKPGDVPGDEVEIGTKEQTIFRGIVARAIYLSQDRSDIRYAVKELSRKMAKPRIRDVNAAERLARYLSTRMRVICHFKYQESPKSLEGWSDSDWAGCLETRKSTSGGQRKLGTHILRTWSTTQGVIALCHQEKQGTMPW